MTAETATHSDPDVTDPATDTSDTDVDISADAGSAVAGGEMLEADDTSVAGTDDVRDVDVDEDEDEDAGVVDGEDTGDSLFEEGEIAGDYLEQLLDVLDFDGDIDLDVDGDRAIVSIDGGDDLTKLVGRKGEVLDALQELTRLAVQQVTGDRSRLMLDIAQWRADRRDRLARLGTEVAERVRDSGSREALDPMSPFERKIVHDAVAAVDGVMSESEGVEPRRRVVVIKVD